MTDEPATRATITLAHLSDPHISCLRDITGRDLASKRLLGYLRWKLHRRTQHADRVLSALQADLAQTEPDHIAVTGDLTHLSLSAEFKKAKRWLQSLGSPSQVTVIPGNHDAYVRINWRQTMAHWTDYMLSDSPRRDDHHAEDADTIFPCLRIRGCIAIIGVSTARPSAPHLAVGRIGAKQLQNLAVILSQTARKRFFRVLLIHHPPAPGSVSWRKRLIDAAALQSLLASYGAELILHGHAHRTLRRNLQTPDGNVPVVGVPSISAVGRTPERRARYYIYRIMPVDAGWNVRLEVRIYSPDDNRFIRESEQRLDDSH
ncbi:MAG: metallophosphoesterase [Deltaproteobacteria bacterium]|nr:metallophosphoesterase [Deltaproteobacteria bacterium]